MRMTSFMPRLHTKAKLLPLSSVGSRKAIQYVLWQQCQGYFYR